jgi:uncharacterized membrane protein
VRAALLWALLGVACQGDEDPAPPDGPADDTSAASDTGTSDTGADLCANAPVVTWENFGAGFVTQNCQACHAASAPERQGAPSDVVFDTEDDVLERSAGVLGRVVDRGDMPPQGGLTDDDRYLTEVWLTCR